jgi:hypothetical protein
MRDITGLLSKIKRGFPVNKNEWRAIPLSSPKSFFLRFLTTFSSYLLAQVSDYACG